MTLPDENQETEGNLSCAPETKQAYRDPGKVVPWETSVLPQFLMGSPFPFSPPLFQASLIHL